MSSFGIAVILCEVITELVVGSSLLARWRNRMLGPDEKAPLLLGILVSCGYCLSVWVALALTFVLRIDDIIPVLGAFEPFAIALIVHRMSNILHVSISFTFKLLEAIVSRISR
jgi:predicted membrane chloride channel (bestrophin family)